MLYYFWHGSLRSQKWVPRGLAHDPVRDPPEFTHDPDNGHPRRVNVWNVGINMGRHASKENVEHVGKDLVFRKFRSKKKCDSFFYFLSPKKYSFFGLGPSPVGGVVARVILFLAWLTPFTKVDTPRAHPWE